LIFARQAHCHRVLPKLVKKAKLFESQKITKRIKKLQSALDALFLRLAHELFCRSTSEQGSTSTEEIQSLQAELAAIKVSLGFTNLLLD
jgi:formate dehydrogenase maturation protein FdhE